MTASQLEAKRKMSEALGALERAQNLILDACENLCPINGLVEEWEDVGKIYDKIKACWHAVNMKVEGGFDLDSAAKARFDEKFNKVFAK